jgi:hypothetical protein
MNAEQRLLHTPLSGLAEAMRDVAASYVIPICWIIARNGQPFYSRQWVRLSPELRRRPVPCYGKPRNPW